MRYVAIENAQPGMVLAYDLYDVQGRTVIGSGCELTANYIKRLYQYGFGGVYIDDDLSNDIYIEPVISPTLRMEGMDCVKNCDIEKCTMIAKAIIQEILPKGRVALDMQDLRSYDDYTYAHSVNVAVLCCVIGMGLEMSERDLDHLVTAALLHDLGKLLIAPEILNKPGRLTREEFAIMKGHARKSFEMLSDRDDISAHIKQAVLFHHENVDGSGYPNGMTGNELSLIVRVLHVADVYDALTSNRPYKRGYEAHEAAEYLMGAGGIMFDKYVVEKFLELIPLYPLGTEVTLSDGSKGIVIENSGVHNLRPVIRLSLSKAEIDLADREYLNLTILAGDKDTEKIRLENEEARKEMMKAPKRYKIVVVDDMVTNLHMLRGILADRYDVVLLKSGNQAINYMRKNDRPDLVILDIDMPEMNGIETAKMLNLMTDGKVPILFVTAVTDPNIVIECRNLHAAGYIIRPYKSIYIKSEIERILNGWEENT